MFDFKKIVPALLLLAAPAFAVSPSGGPMVGHVTDNSARLWMQFPIAGEVTINTFDAAKGTPVSGIRIGLESPSPFVCDVPINGLQPNRTYRIEVKFDGEPVKLPGPDVVIRTAPPPGEESTFTVAFGSGLGIAPMTSAQSQPASVALDATHKIPIFKAITNLNPRAFLFLGQTGLLPPKLDEFPATHRAAYRAIADFHAAIRREPDLQELFRATPTYGIFGERDFGPVGADGRYVYAPESLVAFQRFWPNPDWGTPANPGCFCTFTIGDVDFFLLDSRTFRQEAAATAPAGGGVGGAEPKMLGDAQLDWLRKKLKVSKAAFKIVAAPCALWGDDAAKPGAAGVDSWSRFPAEQADFLKWLADNRIDGLIALAGGQPFGQLTKQDAAGGGALAYPLFSLGTAALLPLPAPPLAEPPADPHRIGDPVLGETFGTLDFGGTREHRFVTLRLRDATGKSRAEQTLLAPNLRN